MALPCRIGADGNRDALPTVLLEAIASGLPCVSTPVTGIPEILDRGRAGSIVPSDDPEAMARSLAALLRAPERRAELAIAARRHALRHFDRTRISSTLRGWFEQALQRSEALCASPT